MNSFILILLSLKTLKSRLKHKSDYFNNTRVHPEILRAEEKKMVWRHGQVAFTSPFHLHDLGFSDCAVTVGKINSGEGTCIFQK